MAANMGLVVTIESTPVQIGTGQADAQGRFSLTVAIPLGTVPGQHHLVVTGLGKANLPHRSIAAITVVRPSSTGLIRTGSEALRLAMTGVAAILIGLVLSGRCRRPVGHHFK